MIRFHNVCKTYRLGDATWTFGPATFKIKHGESAAIKGRSGSGKSTCLHILGGLQAPDSGEVFFDERDISQLSEREGNRFRNEQIGFVFQEFFLVDEFSLLENVALPLTIRKAPHNQALAQAEVMLQKVGLADKARNKPSELSGGQRQRAAIARALITKPQLILADEPTGNLDAQTGTEIIDLLFNINKTEGTTLIVVTHDAAIAKRASRTLELADGKLSSSLSRQGELEEGEEPKKEIKAA